MVNKDIKIIFISLILLIIIAIITVPHDLMDGTDVNDYSDTAKFFAGKYAAKQRTTHSMAYGILLTPYVSIIDNFFLIKFSSVFFLFLIILSLYFISNKNKNVLWLSVLYPVIWYMAPWVSPVPLSSLIFIWTYYFLKKFDKENNLKYLVYSGILIGIGTIFWDTVLYFGAIFMLAFLFDKKLWHSLVYITAIFVAITPRLLIDYLLFDFALFGILKNIFALIAFSFYGGSYGQGYSTGILRIIVMFIFVPYYFFAFYSSKYRSQYKKELIFLTFSLIFLFFNPQIRLVLIIAPIMILMIGKNFTGKHIKFLMLIFLVLSLAAVAPYLIQSKFELSNNYLEQILFDIKGTKISEFSDKIISKDLEHIENEYPDQTFLTGNGNDAYRYLAHIYWGNKIKEFISIEDYELFLANKSNIADRKISSNASSKFRREIWIEVGIGKNSNDNTNYNSIKYAIGLEPEFKLDNFKLVKKYDKLYLFEKIG